ncbi:unnamed protein product, partial [Lymnaea stagnalis]
MDFCLQYRHLIIFLSASSLFIIMCMRSGFALVVTHLTKSNASDLSDVSFFRDCTSYDAGFVSEYSEETSMQFHTAYFVGMVISVILGAYITTRYPAHLVLGANTVMTCGLFLSLPYTFQKTATGVFAIRFLQGLLEGMCQPAIVVLVTSWALKHEKSTMMAVAFIGLFIGPGVSNIFFGACICYIGWDAGIYLSGSAGVLWALVWFPLAYPLPQDCPYIGKQELMRYLEEGETVSRGSKAVAGRIPWKAIITSKPVWAIWLGLFCKSVVLSTILTLQPQFFKDIYGIRAADIGLLLSVPYFVNSSFLFVFSYISDRLIASRLLSVTSVRKLMQCTGVVLEGVFFVCMIYSGTWQTSYAFLTAAYALGGMTFSGYSCNIADLSPQYSGAVAALENTGLMGSVCSTFLASLVTGRNSTYRNWSILFWLEAAVAGATAVVYFLFASGEKQPWADGVKDST